MYALALSIGHNSSAIAIKDGEILGGYEEERFTGKKADSAFPLNSILELNKRFRLPSDTEICVSHWFPDGKLTPESKYFSLKSLMDLFPNGEIYTLSEEFTHHDAHMLSARAFAGRFPTDHHVFVIDGFGSFGECVTVYKDNQVISQVSGYMNSVGLFYQYATAFCGMKMHQDEYKMLAYETHLSEEASIATILLMNEYIDHFSALQWRRMVNESKPCTTLDGLKETQAMVDKTLRGFLAKFSDDYVQERRKRIFVSYFAQRHLQNIIYTIVISANPKNLIVAGGVFLNVKINHMLCNTVPGLFCAMPLSGDQGAGLGVYQRYFGDLKWPNHLFWGPRDLNINALLKVPGITRTTCGDATYNALYQGLRKNGFVNLVRGNMEFGPRALCNTSTLALPKPGIAAEINRINDRTNEMPFAMVVTPSQLKGLFYDTEKVHKSLEYMIMARKFRTGYQVGREGGAHYYPLSNSYTCRPQVTTDPLMVRLLDEFGPLINTSWNYHGVPIVRSTEDVMYTHKKESEKSESEFTTVIEEKE